MFYWTDQRIRWFKQASDYTGYHKTVAQHLKAYLSQEDTLCDIACGLGYLDLELSNWVHQICAVDLDQSVLNELNRQCNKRGIHNLQTIHQDCYEFIQHAAQAPFDVSLFSSFGHLETDLAKFRKLSRKRLIYLKRNPLSGSFQTKEPSNNHSLDDEAYLQEQGIPYHLETFPIDFGQPLIDLEDAIAFLKDYKMAYDEQNPAGFMEQYKIDHTEYQYYIPNLKEVHIIVIEQ